MSMNAMLEQRPVIPCQHAQTQLEVTFVLAMLVIQGMLTLQMDALVISILHFIGR